MSVLEDVSLAKKIIFDTKRNTFERIYSRTNEDLIEIFLQFDFEDKDVLSVLASSDQLFSLYYLGAKNVDTFDINPLTRYYYYLRKWSLEYRHEIDPQDLEVEWFFDLLSNVECSNNEEKNALIFWKKLFLDCQELVTNELLNSADLFLCTAPFTSNIDEIMEIIRKKDFNFSVLDLYKEQDIDKKYDMVVVSNILEYAPDISSLKICCDNLYRCLNENGIVICSNVRYVKASVQEISVFNDRFRYDNGISSENPFNRDLSVVHYYTYTKEK